MYCVYFLYSPKLKNLYIGQTINLEKRIKEHNGGKVKSTKNRYPFVLIRKENYSNRYEAMRREKYLKSLYGYRIRNKILEEYLSRRPIRKS
jgi:putative endonuclease